MKMRCWPVSGSTWIPPATPLPCALTFCWSCSSWQSKGFLGLGFRWSMTWIWPRRRTKFWKKFALGNFFSTWRGGWSFCFLCQVLAQFWCFASKNTWHVLHFFTKSQVFLQAFAQQWWQQLHLFGITYAFNPTFLLWLCRRWSHFTIWNDLKAWVGMRPLHRVKLSRGYARLHVSWWMERSCRIHLRDLQKARQNTEISVIFRDFGMEAFPQTVIPLKRIAIDWGLPKNPCNSGKNMFICMKGPKLRFILHFLSL